jgi:dihydropteroate synthase
VNTQPVIPRIWGVLNVTPDSFSDGGRHESPGRAIEHGLAMAADGAAVIDVGGESTRPGAAPVPLAEEIRRVVPVLRGLREAGVAAGLSVDTRRADVAAAALGAGATIVNDVSAGADPAMLDLVARAGAELVVMHMQGTPRTMQRAPQYEDALEEIAGFLQERVAAAVAAGVERGRLWIDPGIGFGKRLEDNLALLRGLERLVASGPRVLLGASRKSFLGRLTGEPDPSRRLAGSLACALRAVDAGVDAVRVHDVRETRDAMTVYASIRGVGFAP